MTKENRDKTMRLAGKLVSIQASIKESYGDVLMSDARTRDLMSVAEIAISKAVLSAWEKADSEPVEDFKGWHKCQEGGFVKGDAEGRSDE